MFTLHTPLPDDPHLVSIGLLDPHPPGGELRVFDFGVGEVIALDPERVLTVAETDPARASAFPKLRILHQPERAAANRAKVVRLPLRRRRADVSRTFVTGYERYASHRARFWRQHGVGTQALWAAGVFALASIQTPIASTLRLFRLLTPFVIADQLPPASTLTTIVKASGAGLDSPTTGRPAWFAHYYAFRKRIAARIADGLLDDELRRYLALKAGLPLGLGLAKLSFTLALVGHNLGCLDARIVGWSFTKATAQKFVHRINRKKSDGTFSEDVYADYRAAELQILGASPFFDPSDPVGLARAQWMLWESLGDELDRTHTHEELFQAVVDDRLGTL